MSKMDTMLRRLQALTGRPAHGKAVTMRCYLHDAVGVVAGEHMDPPVMGEPARPVLHRARQRKNAVDVPLDGDAGFRVHACLLLWCTTLPPCFVVTSRRIVSETVCGPSALHPEPRPARAPAARATCWRDHLRRRVGHHRAPAPGCGGLDHVSPSGVMRPRTAMRVVNRR